MGEYYPGQITIGGKISMLEAGLFDGISAALSDTLAA